MLNRGTCVAKIYSHHGCVYNDETTQSSVIQKSITNCWIAAALKDNIDHLVFAFAVFLLLINFDFV